MAPIDKIEFESRIAKAIKRGWRRSTGQHMPDEAALNRAKQVSAALSQLFEEDSDDI